VIPPWATAWERSTGGLLSDDQRVFLEQVVDWSPQSSLWSGRTTTFEGFDLEGPADDVKFVCYFRDERRPGLKLAFAWPLASQDSLDDAVWHANFEELLHAGQRLLPTQADGDGIAATSPDRASGGVM